MLFLEPFGATDAGKVRANNEDALLVGEGRDETLFAVADGIGGFEAGEVASRIAIDVLGDLEPGDSFEAAIREANRRILTVGRGDERLSGMGTTVVAVRFGGTREEPAVEIAHVGDSRAYLLRGGELRPVTEDHSLVAELVRSGDLTRAQAAEHPQKNLITRALGADEEVEVDTAVLPVEAGDRLLLCSDGLTDMVAEARIAGILADSPDDPE
ncbi:MAG TPA: PP2C family serine/threonine-protein phosphatase, partial [Rubrobacteraceae bacterium]|nr:PP2C family serine/threonine-protein phosphatase [Rubrobacteraceae bacterium]